MIFSLEPAGTIGVPSDHLWPEGRYNVIMICTQDAWARFQRMSCCLGGCRSMGRTSEIRLKRQIPQNITCLYLLSQVCDHFEIYVQLKCSLCNAMPCFCINDFARTEFEAISKGFAIMMTSSNGSLFPRYWPFVRGLNQSPVNFPHKGPVMRTLMFHWCGPHKLLNKQSNERWYVVHTNC